MLFVNYREIEILGVAIALMLLGVGCYRSLRLIKHPFVRQSLRFIAIGIGSLSLLPLALAGCGLLLTSTSPPIYSPDHRFAARVTDFDGGALGGQTVVQVYSNYGFQNETVFYGFWKTVQSSDVVWLNDSQILIQYRTETGYPVNCNNYREIKVTCVDRFSHLSP